MHDSIVEEYTNVLNIEITVSVLHNGHLTKKVYNPRKGSRGVTDEEQYSNEINGQL